MSEASCLVTKKSLLYNNLEVTDQMLTADQIILRWKEDRRDISRSVNICDIGDLWLYLIPQSEQCSCKIVGLSSIKNVCIGCSIVSRLFRNGDIVLNKATTIKFGAHIGMQYFVTIVKVSHAPIKNYSLVTYSDELIDKLQKYNPLLCPTFFFASNENYVKHYAVISSIMEYEMNKVGIPCIPTFRWIWKCEDNIGIVESVPNLGKGSFNEILKSTEFMETPRSPVARKTSILPLKNEVGRGLLFQLVVSLHFLSSYAFMHGSPSVKSLAFSRTPVDFIYQKVNISSPLTLYIIPSFLSSISMIIPKQTSVIRIFHPGCDSLLKGKPKFPNIDLLNFSNNVSGYKIGENLDIFNYFIKFSGLPLFYKSLDLYLFLTVFMYEESFHQYVHNDESIYSLIKSLFNDEENYKKYLSNIKNLKKRLNGKNYDPSSEDFLNVISDITLRCDAIDHMWRNISILK